MPPTYPSGSAFRDQCHLQQMLWSKQTPVKKVQTPVYDLSQVA